MDYSETMETVDLVLFAKAISDEARQEMMRHLCCTWLNVTELSEKLEGRVKQPTISHHLRLLEDAGLVYSRKEGCQHYFSVNQGRLSMCCGQMVVNFAPSCEITLTMAE